MSLLPSCVFTAAIVARMLNKLGGSLRSFKLGGTIGTCRPNPYGFVGSFELSWIVKIWGSGDAIEETEDIPAV